MTSIAEAALHAALGFALGVGALISLRKNVALYAAAGSRGAAIGLHFIRMAIVVTTFVLIARLAGARGLVFALCGFVLARLIALPRLRRAR